MLHQGILVLDFGTSAVRAFIIDVETGFELSTSSQKYLYEYINPAIAELSPQMLWEKSETAVADALSTLRAPTELLGISFSFFGDNIMVVDARGSPLSNLILSHDQRGTFESAYINSKLGSSFQEITGEQCSRFCPPAKILWMRGNLPALAGRTDLKFWNVQQYIMSRLGFPDYCDYSMASRLVLLDNARGQWSEQLLDTIGVAPSQLGKLINASAPIGTVHHYGQTVLRRELPVLVGGHDVALALLGTGVYGNDLRVVSNVTGTYESFGVFSDTYRMLSSDTENPLLCCYMSAVDRHWLCLADLGPVGLQLEQFLYQSYGNTSPESFSDLWKNAIFGVSYTDFAFQTLHSSRYDSFVALIQHINAESRQALHLLESRLATTFSSVRIGGGFTRSDPWLQLRTDCFRLPVERIENTDVSALGAAVLAAHSLGAYQSIEQAVAAMVKIRDTFYPRTF